MLYTCQEKNDNLAVQYEDVRVLGILLKVLKLLLRHFTMYKVLKINDLLQRRTLW